MSNAIYDTSLKQTNGSVRGLEVYRSLQALAAGNSRLLATIETQTTKEA
ncbi:hypothetical protein [Pseudomonas aeruginosa]|nr:hypothetical protein [Pseudomonas aeruginosa]